MENTMVSLSFRAPGDIRVDRTDIPAITKDEVLVRVTYAGVCGTDNRIFQGTKKIVGPRIIGHEFCGTISRAGKDVLNFSEGERVTAYPTITCGECYACRAGRKNICVNRKTIGYEIDGAFSQYVKIPAEAIAKGNLLHVPPGVSDKAAAISEPMTAAFHGIERANVVEGNAVVIIGAGPLGLFHVQFACLAGAKTIISVEPDPEKRKLASFFGASLTLNPNTDDLKSAILQMTHNEGVDSVILDVGLPQLIADSLGYLKKGGTYVLFAGCAEGSLVTFDPNVIHYREINFTGSSASTPEIQRRVLDLMATGRLRTDELISEIVPINDWKRALEMKQQYRGLKVLIDPWANNG